VLPRPGVESDGVTQTKEHRIKGRGWARPAAHRPEPKARRETIDDLRSVQTAAPRHRSAGDPRVDGGLGRRPPPGGAGPGAVPALPALEAGPDAERRPAAHRPDAVYQHHQPRGGALLPR